MKVDVKVPKQFKFEHDNLNICSARMARSHGRDGLQMLFVLYNDQVGFLC